MSNVTSTFMLSTTVFVRSQWYSSLPANRVWHGEQALFCFEPMKTPSSVSGSICFFCASHAGSSTAYSRLNQFSRCWYWTCETSPLLTSQSLSGIVSLSPGPSSLGLTS